MILNIMIIFVGIFLATLLAFSPKIKNSKKWKATVTPLASIMGSGFLVSAPLLAGVAGLNAVFCMGALLVVAYFVGYAIRFNILHFEPIENQKGIPQEIALLSRVVLAGAYFISITYYIQLLAAFSLNMFHIQSTFYANIISTFLLSSIGLFGMWRGLSLLENLEEYTSSLNLGMIAALIFALAIYNIKLAFNGAWHLPNIDSSIDLKDLRVVLGLLIVVQGFETSRYLGSEFSPQMRISSMKAAQVLSSIIYLAFISLSTVLFKPGSHSANVTDVIGMVSSISIVLPLLLSFAAIISQFSASVADTEGAGGLIQDLTSHKLPRRYIYFLILIITVTFTWETDVKEIISYASRAFALFYALQCGVAFMVAKQNMNLEKRKARLIGFSFLTILCFVVFIFGVPAG